MRRFVERERKRCLAGRDLRQPFRLLRRRAAELQGGRGDQRRLQQRCRRQRAALRFEDLPQADKAERFPARFIRNNHAEKAKLSQLLARRRVIAVRALVAQGAQVRNGQLALHKRHRRLAQHVLIFSEYE